jgi:hypothetical protein
MPVTFDEFKKSYGNFDLAEYRKLKNLLRKIKLSQAKYRFARGLERERLYAELLGLELKYKQYSFARTKKLAQTVVRPKEVVFGNSLRLKRARFA